MSPANRTPSAWPLLLAVGSAVALIVYLLAAGRSFQAATGADALRFEEADSIQVGHDSNSIQVAEEKSNAAAPGAEASRCEDEAQQRAQAFLAARPKSQYYNQCLTDVRARLPIDAQGKEQPHHYVAQTGLWNENERWLPLPLDANSTIMYVGGNTDGADGERLHDQYGSRVLIYEPVPEFYTHLAAKFAAVAGVTTYNYGLAASTRSFRLPLSQLDGQGTFVMDGPHQGSGDSGNSNGFTSLQLLDVAEAMGAAGLLVGVQVDLLHANCEGCEWEMMERISQLGLWPRFRVVQVGTHNYGDGGLAAVVPRYCRVREALSRTHDMQYGVPFGWERWVQREG